MSARRAVENVMIGKLITKFIGTKNEREVKRLRPLVDEINGHFESYASLSEEELKGMTGRFRERLEAGETLDDLLPEAFAVVKEACRRLCGRTWYVSGMQMEWNMVPYDVQLIGGIVLHQGKIAEMATGEGKTLVATMPLYLNALPGKGAHLVTVNDYLARRDKEWMGAIFEYLGLTVGCIQHDMDPATRREQYRCDITYGTNNEFGFDYLRDNMATHRENQVQRGFYYAIVDEVDSVLIDEARTPLIISGPVAQSSHQFDKVRDPVRALVRHQTEWVNDLVREAQKLLATGDEDDRYAAGIQLLQVRRGQPKSRKFTKIVQEPGIRKLINSVEADFMREKKLSEVDEDLFYSMDEKAHSIDLTEKGRTFLSPDDPDLFTIPDLPEELHRIDHTEGLSESDRVAEREKLQKLYIDRNEVIHNIRQLLKAYSLFEKDVDYVVQDGKVMIVDEFTGRLMPGRRFSEGLHQALEAKEGVVIEKETQTFATITLQNFFRMYDKLSGMTGTAETEASEFFEIYKLDVVVIPTHVPVIRIDDQDVILKTRREKYNALVQEIADAYKRGQPVLVGTVSVEVSETISRILKRMKIPHNVLNAKNHQGEAEIVARAGELHSVTIATNMAGRGTDIKLGPGVVEVGGLHIVGTERHESRRIDRQLRGRAGRQGDPGSSRFYLSLEDDLMRLFAPERIAGVMDRIGLQEGEVIEHPLVSRAIERAQKKVEAHNFEIRKHLLKYDDVMNQQREVIYNRRDSILKADDLREEFEITLEDVIDTLTADFLDRGEFSEEWDVPEMKAALGEIFLDPFDLAILEEPKPEKEEVKAEILRHAKELYTSRREARVAFLEEQNMPPELIVEFERGVMLSKLDDQWKDHLYELDGLKSGIGLRAYGQKDPLLEYKSEAFELFRELILRIDRETIRHLYMPINLKAPPRRAPARPLRLRESHDSVSAMSASGGAPGRRAAGGGPVPAKTATVQRRERKVGRNEPCPCGSGKKYKACCGK